MNIDLAGKRAIVAGGSRGIGRAIALALAEAGAGVSICARGAERLAATREEIARHGSTAHSAVCDLADAAAIPRYIEDAAGGTRRHRHPGQQRLGFRHKRRRGRVGGQRLGRSDGDGARVACGSARISKNPAPARSSTSRRSRAFAPRPAPRLTRPSRRRSCEYTLTQAASLARKGIRVNCIAPGSIEFPGGTWERARLNNPDLYGRILRSIPFGRLGKPEEIAQVALFLCSPLAGWVTGQNIAVDGGQML